MKNQNSMSVSGFAAECAIDGLIAMVWYKKLLFRCLPSRTFFESQMILWVMVVLFIALDVWIFVRHRRNEWSVAVCLLLPYGLYTVLAYMKSMGTLIIVILIIAGILSSLFTLLFMTRKINPKAKKKKVLKFRMGQCIYVSHSFLAVGMVVIMLTLFSGDVFGISIINASIPATTNESANEQTISGNMQTILLLQNEEWASLDTQQRLDVMQTVANIEANYLGISTDLNVGTDNLEENVLGCYSDATHTIFFDLNHLENDSPQEVLNICCHEAFHAYEHRLVDAYHGADEQSKKLRIYKKAISYENEFDHYDDGKTDYFAYYDQKCEDDSREYAESAVNDYYARIDEYLKSQENKNSSKQKV